MDTESGQLFLEIQAAYSRHAHVEYQTSRRIWPIRRQKIADRGVRPSDEADTAQKAVDGTRIDSSSSMI
jgi:hypothetical protein